jgi:hypothetical protein
MHSNFTAEMVYDILFSTIWSHLSALYCSISQSFNEAPKPISYNYQQRSKYFQNGKTSASYCQVGFTCCSSPRPTEGRTPCSGTPTLKVHCTENPIFVFQEMKLRGLVPNLSTMLRYTHSQSTLYRKSDFGIPRNGIAWPRSQFLHSCICERFIYSQDRSAYLAAAK